MMNKQIINIKGMHCRSCEILIEDELKLIPGIAKIDINYQKGAAEIYYYQDHLDIEAVNRAIIKAGYAIGKEELPWFSKVSYDYLELFTIVAVILFFYFIFSELGFFNIQLVKSSNYSSLPIVFLIGLTAGVSSCLALVGGLVLGASARFAEKHPYATPLQKFKPHLFFNLGRIISFFVLGGIIGLGGSLFQLSPFTLGILTIIVGLIMFFLGLQLVEISPRLKTISFTLPKGIARKLGLGSRNQEYSHKNAFMSGAATFFLPCGFTQAMQLYAISTGDAFKGALTMSLFAIGTAPGLLGIGGLTSFVKGAFTKPFFKFVGVIVILLATFNISNGINLSGLGTGLPLLNSKNVALANTANVTLENGVQIVKMTQTSSGYEPNNFTIKKDIPVRWIINSLDANSCAASIASSKLGIKQVLQPGENIIEFTPKEIGQIRFTCIMGMYGGSFNVVDENYNVSASTNNNPAPKVNQGGCGGGGAGSKVVSQGGCGGGGGGCGGGCGGGSLKNRPTTSEPVLPTIINGTQVIKATYTQSQDIQPNLFALTVDQPARLEIDVKEDGAGCMRSITLPKLTDKIEVLTKGKTITFDFTPKTTGNFNITCAMGMSRGGIVVKQANNAFKNNNQAISSSASPSASPKTEINSTNSTQFIKAIYTSGTDIQPNQFTIKAGIPTRMEISVQDNGYGCMGSITIPDLTDKVEVLTKGKVIVFNFSAPKPGKYDITCAMGVPRGTITVN